MEQGRRMEWVGSHPFKNRMSACIVFLIKVITLHPFSWINISEKFWMFTELVLLCLSKIIAVYCFVSDVCNHKVFYSNKLVDKFWLLTEHLVSTSSSIAITSSPRCRSFLRCRSYVGVISISILLRLAVCCSVSHICSNRCFEDVAAGQIIQLLSGADKLRVV